MKVVFEGFQQIKNNKNVQWLKAGMSLVSSNNVQCDTNNGEQREAGWDQRLLDPEDLCKESRICS